MRNIETSSVLAIDNLPNLQKVLRSWKEEGAWGMHLLLDVQDCYYKSIQSKDNVKKWVKALCGPEGIDMVMHGETLVEHFGDDPKVAGLSAMQLIETSCITAHFANHDNSAYLDIFSCKPFDPNVAVAISQDFFSFDPLKVQARVVLRGTDQ